MHLQIRRGRRGRRPSAVLSFVLLALIAACAPGPRPSTRGVRVPEPEPGPGDADAEIAYLISRALMVPVAGIAPLDLANSFDAPRGSRRHNAIDILAPRGTPVLAADDGRILKLRSNSAGGITIYALDPSEDYIFYYAHLDRYRRGLEEGDDVRRGDVLGYVGTTGNAPDHIPHLHFQLMRLVDPSRWWEGRPIDPLPFLVLPGDES